MSPSEARVLILDLSVDPEMYRPTDHWRALLGDTPSDSVALLRNGRVGSLDDYTHVIVSGSEASVLDHQPWFTPAEDAIREAVKRGLPVLGSCFGHQLIVRALHGPEHLRRSASPELGWFPVEITGQDPNGPLDADAPQWMFCCHFDEVHGLDGAYRVLAHTGDCAVHAYRLSEAAVWGVQAHPEISPKEGAALLRAFAAQNPELTELVDHALAKQPRDDGFGAVLTRRFLECT